MKKRRTTLTFLLIAMAAMLLVGCGWDSTPVLIIPTPVPTEVPTPQRPSSGTAEPRRTLAPGETPDPNATEEPEESPDSHATQDPNATEVPQNKIDPYLIGLWSFVYSTYKGATTVAKDTGHSIVIRFYDEGSATIVYDNEETTGLRYTLVGATLTLTIYGEPYMTMFYDGTHVIWEVPNVFDDYDDIYFERIGD